ncbi:sulfite exporter TauE/SafE family protein [Sphingobacterium sp. lm-10]|uniref:sulfite exporter TauE/SafE family protein n=1 Tax=Sphingobacterium sp. lm-10 TaxID=2944904 RepID=UPI0020204546|nr:sulfite exporter TauE/SafE family protein [Sphingobacterium sp. lm-10]MCL7986326.1 sulfite exporter TauE/SafE family protein [Sphingobacterium sp. lm-10]
MHYVYFAYFMGLFGSLHCAVMCGPLIYSVQRHQNNFFAGLLFQLRYQSGRVITYGLLGILFGLIGQASKIGGWQQTISVISGILLLLIGCFQFLGFKSASAQRFQSWLVQPFARGMGHWMHRPSGSFVAGMFHGMLPCGMVYVALTSAVNADGVWPSFLFMLAFGLGTWPMLFVFSFLAHWSKRCVRWRFAWILPGLYVLMGIWFILRGSNLDIPYLSPLLYPTGASHCS